MAHNYRLGKQIPINIYFDPGLLRELDAVRAEKYSGVPRTEFIRQLLRKQLLQETYNMKPKATDDNNKGKPDME